MVVFDFFASVLAGAAEVGFSFDVLVLVGVVSCAVMRVTRLVDDFLLGFATAYSPNLIACLCRLSSSSVARCSEGCQEMKAPIYSFSPLALTRAITVMWLSGR